MFALTNMCQCTAREKLETQMVLREAIINTFYRARIHRASELEREYIAYRYSPKRLSQINGNASFSTFLPLSTLATLRYSTLRLFTYIYLSGQKQQSSFCKSLRSVKQSSQLYDFHMEHKKRDALHVEMGFFRMPIKITGKIVHCSQPFPSHKNEQCRRNIFPQ